MLHENDGPHVQENHTIRANEHFTLLGKKQLFISPFVNPKSAEYRKQNILGLKSV